MKYFPKRDLTTVILLTTILFTTGCDEGRQTSAVQIPESITPTDECHICGMNIARFPGPKGQAFIRHQHTPLKFCSTVELYGWMLQPDTPAILATAYVHDMGAATSWDKPDDQHFVDAKAVWYVADHDQAGSMGATLASFKDKEAAELFIKQHSGRLLSSSQIDLKVLSGLQLISTKPIPAQQTRSYQDH